MADILEAIFRRRSIRRYTEQQVEKEKLELLLQAAMAAPNACNSQPWEFVVVTDKDVMARLRDALYAGHYNAPCAIAVCGNLGIANNSAAKYYWVQDCSAATENLIIAATALGLGTVWIGVYPLPSVIKPVSEILNLADGVVPLSIVYVGYPAEEKPPRTQVDEHRVYWDQYAPRKPRGKTKNAKHLP